MSDILDRLKNLENEQPSVLRTVAAVPSRTRRSTKRRIRFYVILFSAFVLSATYFAFQFKSLFYPKTEVPTAVSIDLGLAQNQQNQAAIDSYQKGDYKQAVEQLEKIVKEQPERAEFHVNLAMAYEQLASFDKAFEQLKLAVTLDPKNSFAHNNLGLLAEQRKQNELAQQSFEKAVELNPSSPELKLNLASFYERTGQLKKSVQTYEDFARSPAADKQKIELVKKRIPRLNSLTVQSERTEEGS